MAGHSQFKNIMHRKGAQDAKRAKTFGKLAREIIVAAKSGLPDPTMNPRLRSALAAARSANMPKDNVERAIKKATNDTGDTQFFEVCYEGYGPQGVAVIVETLTDNKNRTAAEVRSCFNKFGGNLGESGSVSFSFNHQGQVVYTKETIGDDYFDKAIDCGVDDIQEEEDFVIFTCEMAQFAKVRNACLDTFGDPEQAKLVWTPTTTIAVPEDSLSTLTKLVDALEDSDDVQTVFTSADNL